MAETASGGLFAPLRRLYQWVLSWAQSPYAVAALFVVSFVESSFFPIPPDPLLMALCLGMASRSLYFAAVCTVASVLGGLLGYGIGMYAYEWIGVPILQFYGKVDDFQSLAEEFRAVGNLAVLLAAITPIPYKLVTIASGAAGMNVPAFVVASIVGRGLRFFALAGLIWWKGKAIAQFIEDRFELLSVAFGVLLVGGFAALRLLAH